MLLDPDDSRPPYAQVVDALRREIEEGSLPAGAKLPTHQQMASQYGVSIGTVKRALGELQGAGLVISRQGQGTFVRTRRSILDSVPHSLSADAISGIWVTSYQFQWTGDLYHHADITQITAQSSRRLTALNHPPDARSSAPTPPFLNEIEAQLINRHVIGHWKNVNDTRYFGSLQLAVLTGETMLHGYYTSYLTDVEVSAMPWKWARIDPLTLHEVKWADVKLDDPTNVYNILEQATGPLALSDITEQET